MYIMECKQVSFRYGPEEPLIIEDLSLAVEKGTCLVVEGDNGCGKTTLFRILNGLSFPVEGSFWFDGIQITEKYLKKNANAKQFHKRVGYLFQNPDLMLFHAKVYDEIAFGPRQMGLSDGEVDRRVRDCLKLFQLEQLTDKVPFHLSGGQKKMAALACVMALNPEVLVLDEPYAGLDRKTGSWLTEFLKELKTAGKTLILSTHDKGETKEYGDFVLNLNQNKSGQ